MRKIGCPGGTGMREYSGWTHALRCPEWVSPGAGSQDRVLGTWWWFSCPSGLIHATPADMACIHAHTYNYIQIHTHTYTYIHILTHTCTCMCQQANTDGSKIPTGYRHIPAHTCRYMQIPISPIYLHIYLHIPTWQILVGYLC